MTKNKQERCLGAHVSASGGVWHAWENAEAIGATGMQIFTANQMQWHPKAPSPDDIGKYLDGKISSGVRQVMSHASYLINLCSPKGDIQEKSIAALAQEIERCVALKLDFLTFHPGSHLGEGEDWGLKTIAKNLDGLRPLYKGSGLKILLETTAGQGSNLGYKFDQLATIIAAMKDADAIGVCLDTCHVFAAGYDWRETPGYEAMWKEFATVIGMERLHAFHVNDSQKDGGTRVDRHADLGKGKIGIEPFKRLIKDPRFTDHLFVLETPGGPDGWREEIKLLRSF